MSKIFYLSIFLLPLVYFKVYQNLNITFADIVLLALFALVLFKIKVTLTLTTRIYLSFIFIYIISGFLSTIKAPSIIDASFGILQHAFIFLGIFLVMYHFIQEKEQIDNMLKILIFMGVLSVFYTLISETSTGHGRHYSYLGSLSVYGLFLTSIMPFVWYLYSISKKLTFKFIYIIAFCVLIYGLVLSGSRSGIIVFILVIFLMLHFSLLSKIKRKDVRILTYFLIFTFLITFLINFESFIRQLIEMVVYIQPNLAIKLETLLVGDLREMDTSRYDNISSFFTNFNHYMFLGVGFNNFHIVTNSMSLHSFLLAIWAELGIVSFISMVILIVYLFFRLYRLYKRYNDNLLAALIISNVACFIFMSLNPLYTHRVTWIFFIIAYSTVILYERKRGKRNESSIYNK